MLGTLSWYSWGSVYAVRSGNRTVLCLTFVKRFHSSGPPVDPVSVPCARRYRPGGSHSISGSSAMSGADGVPNPVLHVSGNPESAPRPDAVPSEPPTSAVAMPTGLQPQAHVRQPSRAAGNTGPSQPLPSDAFLLPVAVASSSSPDGQPQPGRGHVRAPSKQAAADHGGGRRSIRTHARAPSRYVMDADQQVHPTATFQLPSGVQDDDEPSGGRPRKDPQDLARKDRALPSAKQAALEQHMARSADSQLVVASPAPESRHSSGTGSNGASVKAGPAEPRSMKGGEARHRNGSPVSPGGDHRLQERRQVVARSSPVGVKPRLFVSLMIVTDVALCVYSMYLNGWQFESFSTNPLLGPSSSVLDGMGAKDTGRIRAGEWWRLVTAMCLHSYGLASAPESLALPLTCSQRGPPPGRQHVDAVAARRLPRAGVRVRARRHRLRARGHQRRHPQRPVPADADLGRGIRRPVRVAGRPLRLVAAAPTLLCPTDVVVVVAQGTLHITTG